MNRMLLKAWLGLFFLAFSVVPATAQISLGAPRNSINAVYSVKHFVAFDSLHQVYLVVWDQWPNVMGVFVNGNSEPIGNPFAIGAPDAGTELGYSRVTVGGPPDRPRFLVTYAVENGTTRPKMAKLVTFNAIGQPPDISPAYTIAGLGNEISWSENSESVWSQTAQKFVVSWRVGPTSNPASPVLSSAVRFMDLDGNLGPVVFLGDSLDAEANPTLACNSTVCLAFGYAYGIPFPNVMSASWARLFRADTLEPLNSVFYLDDHSGLMEDQRVVYDEGAGVFHTAWIRGRSYVDFRSVDTSGQPGPLDLTKSVGPRWGQLTFSYNRGTKTSLIAGTSPVPGTTDVQDMRALEVGPDGYPRDMNNVLIVSDQASDRRAMEYNPHAAADHGNGEWMIIYSGVYAGRVIGVRGTLASSTRPSVTGVSPATGPWAGGTSVTITGNNFQAGATVTFGGRPATGVVVRSATEIGAVSPWNPAGVVAVSVSNPGGEYGSLPAAFTYKMTPLGDFNGDGYADLVWRNRTTGELIVWYMNGGAYAGYVSVPVSLDPAWRVAAIGDFNGDGRPDVAGRNLTTGENAIGLNDGNGGLVITAIPSVADPNWRIVGAGDFNGDGKSDLVWRNAVTGENQVWFINGATYAGFAWLDGIADANWRIVAVADFNGDSKPELLWRNVATGDNLIWYMTGTTHMSVAAIPAITDSRWSIVAAPDLNGDGMADVLWRNTATGENVVWFMNNATVTNWAALPSLADASWEIFDGPDSAAAGPGDVNCDGSGDVLWRNTATGANRVWYTRNGAVLATADLPPISDTSWRLVASYDFNGDARPDILWHNVSTGENIVWYMLGSAYAGYAVLPRVADLSWQPVAVADFNRDGKADILWRNSVTGQNLVWYLDGVTYIGFATLPPVADTAWHIAAVADFNGNGMPDIVWQNRSTGENLVWYMDGTAYAGYAYIMSGSSTSWQIAGAGDYNGDGKTDLLWYNVLSGQTGLWFMDGVQYLSGVSLPTEADLQWKIGPGQ